MKKEREILFTTIKIQIIINCLNELINKTVSNIIRKRLSPVNQKDFFIKNRAIFLAIK